MTYTQPLFNKLLILMHKSRQTFRKATRTRNQNRDTSNRTRRISIESRRRFNFELSEKTGVITKLGFLEDLPSDENFLHQSIKDINELFAQLLEIEDELYRQ